MYAWLWLCVPLHCATIPSKVCLTVLVVVVVYKLKIIKTTLATKPTTKVSFFLKPFFQAKINPQTFKFPRQNSWKISNLTLKLIQKHTKTNYCLFLKSLLYSECKFLYFFCLFIYNFFYDLFQFFFCIFFTDNFCFCF